MVSFWFLSGWKSYHDSVGIDKMKRFLKKVKFHKINSRLLNKGISLSPRILTPLETFLIKRYTTEEIKYPPTFIIGAPRTGSTISYEYISNYLDVTYISNFMCKFYKTLYLALVVSKVIFKDKEHNFFYSKQGRTQGLNSPSECGQFWYRWFPKDRHFVDFNELDSAQITQIQDVIKAVVNRNNKPIVFKNMNCGQRLRVIKDIFPNALFIYCRRDPLYTAQSIIETREKVYGSRTEWWSIMPKEYNELLKLDYPEQVVKQIYYIQKQIEEDLSLFGKKQFIEIWYEDFCESPELTIENIKDFMSRSGVDVRCKAKVIENQINLSQQRRIDRTTWDKLSEIINSLNW